MEQLKEFRNSFLLYDVFGYFLPGFFFVCLLIIDYDLSKIMEFYSEHHTLRGIEDEKILYKLDYLFRFLTWNTESDFKFTTLVIFIFFCYLLGHVIAALSSYVIEQWFNRRFLGFPSENLIDSSERNWFRTRFAFYTKGFTNEFAKKFEKVFRERFGTEPVVKDYFWLCFSDICKHSPVGYNRVIHFLNLYGFSRNICAAFIIYIVFRIILCITLNSPIHGFTWFILVSYSFGAFIMLINYLKLFYRQCIELYYHFYSLHTNPEI
jgi:hypothetical protein